MVNSPKPPNKLEKYSQSAPKLRVVERVPSTSLLTMKLSLTASVLAIILSCSSSSAFVSPEIGNGCFVPKKWESRDMGIPSVPQTDVHQRCKSTVLHMGLGSFLKKKVMRRGDDDNNKNKKPAKKSVLGKRDNIGKGKSGSSSSSTTKKNSMPEVNPLPTPLPTPPPARAATGTSQKLPVTAAGRKGTAGTVKANVPRQKTSASIPKDSFDEYRVKGAETAQDRINRVKSGKMTDQEKQAFLRTALSTKKTTSSRAPLRQEIPADELGEDSNKKKGNASPFPTDSLLRNFARGKSKEEAGSGQHAAPPIEMDSDRKKREYFEMVTNPDRFKALAPTVQGAAAAAADGGSSSARTASELDDEIDQLQQEIEEAKSMTDSVSVSSSDDSLGSRLEAGAYAAEQRTRELREKEEALRRKQEERVLELQRERNEQMAQREAEALAKKREQEELMQQAEAQKRTAEEQRLKELQQKQDEYWASKLQNQKAQQLEELSEEETQREAEAEMFRLEQEQEAEAERIRIREEERQREDPHEGEILKEAEEERSRIKEQNFNTIAKSASDVSGRPTLDSLNDVRSDASLSSFFNKPGNQKPATPSDAMMEQLKSMNSPLPSSSPSPRVAPSPAVVPQTFAPPPAPRPIGIVPQQAKPVGGTGPSIRDMLSKSNNNNDDDNTPAPAPPVRQQAPFEPQKRRVVRQQVFMDDADEDEEFEAFSRNGPNKGMSIADAMKSSNSDDGDSDERGAQEQRAKMWGIDMSKFSD